METKTTLTDANMLESHCILTAKLINEEANEKLHNAAPELLEALRELVRNVRYKGKLNIKNDFSLIVALAYAEKVIYKIGEEN